MRIASPFHPHHARLLWVLTALWGAVGVFSLSLWFFGPPFLPLWLSLVEPSEQLAPKIAIWVFPAITTPLYFLTLWFSRKNSLEHEEYLATLSLWSGIILLSLFLFAIIRIMKVIL